MDPRSLLNETTPFLSPRPALDGLASELADRRVAGAPHTIAEIVAHLVFWQDWFAGRCDGSSGPMPGAASIGWPVPAPGSWDTLERQFLHGLDRLVALGSTTGLARRIDPPIEFPPLAEYTVGEVLIHVGAHNAHHLGQIVLLRQMLDTWPPPAGAYTW